ncbi:MAG: hypothetical protein GY771_07010 [bacterium]|nr:hypothetical protein [bacterium]
MEKTGGDSSFVIHTLVVGNQQTFIILGKGKEPKIVNVYGPTSFTKPKREKDADVAATLAFGMFGLLSGDDQECYEFGVKNCEGFWDVLGESDDKLENKGWYGFKVDVEGSQVSFSIDDRLLLQCGSTEENGSIGFSAVDDAVVYLDDIKIGRIIK